MARVRQCSRCGEDLIWPQEVVKLEDGTYAHRYCPDDTEADTETNHEALSDRIGW